MKAIGVQLLLAIIVSLTVHAKASNKQDVLNKEVSITMEKAEIKKVLAKIKEQSGVEFVYSSKLIHSNTRISINAYQNKLKEILDEVLLPLNIHYKVINDQIVLYRQTVQNGEKVISAVILGEPDADRVITGKITNASGEPLSGVSVVVKGTQVGTTTGVNGNFSIAVPDGSDY